MNKNVKEFTEELPEFKYRLRVKAGLTGYAQIAGKYNTTPKDKLIMEYAPLIKFIAQKIAVRLPSNIELDDLISSGVIGLMDAIEKYTYGAALFEASARARNVAPMPPVDPGKYPSLAQAVADNPYDDDALFVESLRLFLAGVRARIADCTLGQPIA